MNAEPDWALSVAELERVGLRPTQAKAAVGVPPAFPLDGRWVVLIDDEPYDAKTARVIEIDGGIATCSRGARGTVERLRKVALVRFPPERPDGIEECIAISTAQASDFLIGTSYTGRDLPEGDPAVFCASVDDDDADDVDLPIADVAWLYREDAVPNAVQSAEAA